MSQTEDSELAIIDDLEREVDSLQDRLHNAKVKAEVATDFIHYLAEKSGVLHTTANMLLEGRRFEVLRDLLRKADR